MVWTVVMTEDAQRWFLMLGEEDERRVGEALDALREKGRRSVVRGRIGSRPPVITT